MYFSLKYPDKKLDTMGTTLKKGSFDTIDLFQNVTFVHMRLMIQERFPYIYKGY